MRKTAALICLALACSAASGQTPVDSLRRELAAYATRDTVRIRLLLEIADALVWNDPGEALDHAQEAHHLAEALHWEKGIAHALRQEGIIHYEQSDPLRAMDVFQRALRAAEPLHNKAFNASIYNNIANIYSDLTQYDKASEHYNNLLAIARELSDTTNQVIAMVNLASVFIEQQDMPQGIAYLTKALPMAKAIANQRFEMAIRNNLGRALAKQGKDEDALHHFEASLLLAEQLGSTSVKATVLNSISELLINQGDYPAAERHSKEARALAETVGALEWQANAWQTLSTLYERQGKADSALDAYRSFIALRDSAANEEKKAEITRKEMQFALEKQEALAAAKIGRQRMLMYAIAGLALAVTGALVLGWKLYKRRRDENERQKIAEFEMLVADTEMKALRAQLNPHFIFNSLNAIGNCIAKQDLPAAAEYLDKFSKLLRMILEHSTHQEIALSTDLEVLDLYLQVEANRLKGKFTYEIDVDTDIDPENTLVPPLILQPLVENSIWHGLAPKDGTGNIWIRVRRSGDLLHYTVEDNGVGRTKANGRAATSKSLGIALTEARVAIIGKRSGSASISFDDLPQGLAATVKMPLSLQF